MVVVSLFVNPAQFGPGEDFAAYPRDEARDAGPGRRGGRGRALRPAPARRSTPTGFATTMSVAGLTEVLEGDPAGRGPEHFSGVATVVAKLLNMVQPDVAYFGQKDAQQALVIQRLVRDLDIPVRVTVCPTVRDHDGLALSSRNAYLDPEERERAGGAVARAAGGRGAGGRRRAGRASGCSTPRAPSCARPAWSPSTSSFGPQQDLSPVERVNGSTLLAVAARVGRARLIDNTILGGAK